MCVTVRRHAVAVVGPPSVLREDGAGEDKHPPGAGAVQEQPEAGAGQEQLCERTHARMHTDTCCAGANGERKAIIRSCFLVLLPDVSLPFYVVNLQQKHRVVCLYVCVFVSTCLCVTPVVIQWYL